MAEVRAFLSHLAVEQQMRASSQNNAFAAFTVLHREVLEVPFAELERVVRAQTARTHGARWQRKQGSLTMFPLNQVAEL